MQTFQGAAHHQTCPVKVDFTLNDMLNVLSPLLQCIQQEVQQNFVTIKQLQLTQQLNPRSLGTNWPQLPPPPLLRTSSPQPTSNNGGWQQVRGGAKRQSVPAPSVIPVQNAKHICPFN